MHIGGGEPLTDPDNLSQVLAAANDAGVAIDYVETNSAWYKNARQAAEVLNALKRQGLQTLLVSISPFHTEYIPFAKVTGVMAACRRAGLNIFPWMETFMGDLSAIDPEKTHRFNTLIKQFGNDYLAEIRARYWIHLGGRALGAFRPLYSPQTARAILDAEEETCRTALSDTSHFHMDMNGNYIPGLCSGLGISISDLGDTLCPETYPVITALAERGIRGLYQFAVSRSGYCGGKKTFINKCDLCNDIRQYLFEKGWHLNELTPGGYYKE